MKLLYAEDEPALSEAIVDYLTYHKSIVCEPLLGAMDISKYLTTGNRVCIRWRRIGC